MRVGRRQAALCAMALCLVPAGLAAQGSPEDSVVYELSPASSFEVKTGKAGLLGFAGHDHVIRARAWSGRIVFHPHAPARSRVEIVVPAESLEVLTPPDTAEIRKVTETMRTDVLHVEAYPDVTFVSTAVTPTDHGFRVQGQLTLVGEQREVGAALDAEVGADTLRATGSFSVKQSEFGIKPYRGGPAGMVRVADRVTFHIDVIGVRSAGP